MMGTGSSRTVPSKRYNPPEFSEKEAAKRNERIERLLLHDHRLQNRTIKILLLGGPESGKSTIFKQMRILHMNGFTEADIINYRFLVHSNTVRALQQLLDGCKTLKIDLGKELGTDLQQFSKFVKSDRYGYYILDSQLGEVISRIWNSSPVQKAFSQRHHFTILDSAQYFLSDVGRVSADSYRPNYQDIVRTRIPTIGINEILFDFKASSLRMVDVGGQRSEQRKWIHCFDDVQAILFVAALPDYDLLLDEDLETNRLMHSMDIFKRISANEYFVKTAMILFLNKVDIFDEKILYAPLDKIFPSYQGGGSVEKAKEFVESEFKRHFQKEENKLYVHFTVATDTKNVQKVFQSCMDVIFKENMGSVGFS